MMKQSFKIHINALDVINLQVSQGFLHFETYYFYVSRAGYVASTYVQFNR